MYPWVSCVTKPWGYAIQHMPVPVPSQDKLGWEGCGRKGIRSKNGGMMEVDCWLVLMEWRPCGLSECPRLVVFPSSIKSRRSFLLAPADPDGPGKRAVKRLWLCGGGILAPKLCILPFFGFLSRQVSWVVDFVCSTWPSVSQMWTVTSQAVDISHHIVSH